MQEFLRRAAEVVQQMGLATEDPFFTPQNLLGLTVPDDVAREIEDAVRSQKNSLHRRTCIGYLQLLWFTEHGVAAGIREDLYEPALRLLERGIRLGLDNDRGIVADGHGFGRRTWRDRHGREAIDISEQALEAADSVDGFGRGD